MYELPKGSEYKQLIHETLVSPDLKAALDAGPKFWELSAIYYEESPTTVATDIHRSNGEKDAEYIWNPICTLIRNFLLQKSTLTTANQGWVWLVVTTIQLMHQTFRPVSWTKPNIWLEFGSFIDTIWGRDGIT